MRAAIYGRVSTNRQEYENQLLELRPFVERMGWQLVEEYVEVESGGKARSGRPAFDRMMLDASKRKFDVVVFWALDRLSREGVYETLTYLRNLDSWGVAFRSYNEPYLDSTGFFKEAIISILAALAKQEKQRLSDRVKAGQQRAKEKHGRVPGRPTLSAEAKEEIKNLRKAKKSNRAIGRILEISHHTVAKYLAELEAEEAAQND